MVQKYHRAWSLMMAMILLCSCVLSPLSVRVSATTQNEDTLSSQGEAASGELKESSGEDSAEKSGEAAIAETGEDPVEETADDPTEETEENPEEETADDPAEETEEDPEEETADDPTGEAGEGSGEETAADPTEEAGEPFPEAADEESEREADAMAEAAPVSPEPDHTGYSVIPGMQAHMLSKPGSDYKTVTPSLSFFSYLDLELFEGIAVDHINVYAGQVAAADDNQYMTVSVVDSATAEVVSEHRFYARAEALANFTPGQILSLYPGEGDAVTVAEGQTLGFGKNGDPLVCNFQNDNNVPASLKGFYTNRGFASGTAGGSLCVDVYAKEAPQISERDAVLSRVLAGKKLSILGDSISTYAGVSNSTAVNSTLGSNGVWYADGKAPFSVLQTWWRQAADRYGREILVNNAWSGATVATYAGKPGASCGWNTRPDNLHDNTGAVVNPDIIAIYMGANDLSLEIPCDPDALTEEFYARIEAEDYAPAEVTALQEAAALMVHKVRRNYPDAAIYLFNCPAMRNGSAYRNAYNQVLDGLAERYRCQLVDLYGSALSNHAAYTTDGVHPNSAGMDVMTEVFAEALYKRYLGHTEHTWVTVPGVPATFREPGLTEGIKCAECGEIQVAQEVIPVLDYAPRVFNWELSADGSALVSSQAALLTANDLSLEAGAIQGGVFNGVQLALADPLELRHDYPWSIEWRSSGTWAANSLLFSTEKTNTAAGNVYIYRPSNFVSLGTYQSGGFHNYAASLAGYNNSAEHTFRLANRVHDDGSNMVYLYVDGTEIAPLNQHYIANNLQNPPQSDWVSGKDFRFRYIGARGHLVSGSGLKYLQVNEGQPHDTHSEQILPAVPPTQLESGLTEGKRCSDCGAILAVQQKVPALRETMLESALMGKKLSVLGDGISTYTGVSNSTAVNNTLGGNAVWYHSGRLPSAQDTWWRQAADRYGMEILVNNSWAGASVTSVCSDQGESSYGWNTRPGQLHDNTGTTVNPDIIAVYMGSNDLAANVACGTTILDEGFYGRIESPDFLPSAETKFEEAAALMLHKVVTGYPDAEVFLFNLPAMSTGTDASRDEYNQVFRQLADHYGCTLVDLHSSAISDHSAYTQDGIHPNGAGMDVMTEVFADALYERLVTSPDAPSAATKKGVYLSDLNYIPSGTSVGSGGYKKDNSPSGSQIQLRVDGSVVTFEKGIGAHAPSTITFNISQYHQEYPRLCAKLGVDARQNAKGAVRFQILGSNTPTAYSDSSGWTVLLTTDTLTAASAAVEVDLDVSGYSYIRLYADHLGATANDHSVYADARLVKADYDIDSEYFSRLHGLAWYDEQLSQNDYAFNLENNQNLILEREFVSRMGLATIQNCVKNSVTMADTLTWLLEDSDALQLFIETGNILAPANTLRALDTLYTNYGELLGDSGDSYVYKKMAIALAVTWANDRVLTPYSFGGGVMGSSSWHFDILERFRAAKWVYDSGPMIGGYTKELYASYNMELMRMLVGDYIGLDELKWVHHYAAKKYPDQPNYWTGPYRFMSYVHPPLYARQEYFNAETWPGYDAKYDLSQYNLPRSEWDNKVYRMWMVYEAGGICWNISRIGTTLNKSYRIPTVGTFQPGHEAYFTYSQNEAGQGIWSIGNNVGGWACVYSNWAGTTTRMPLNWGSGTAYSQKTRNSSTYILLAQGALNQYGQWQKSLYLNMLADAYDSPEEKLSVYRASLDALDLNLDTYLDIIALYQEQGDAITPETWLSLAMEIIDAYTYYPVAMVDLVNAIEPYCGNYGTNLISAKTKALEKARVATEAESLQYSACITLANSMLGREVNDVLATFSFDGEHAGAIVLGESYEQYAFELQYSLDGGETWHNHIKDVDSGRVIQLTADQISSLNTQDDILMYISGMNMEGEDPDYFTIDIREGTAPVVGQSNAASEISIHDGENWIQGKTRALEYSTDGGNTWRAYDHEVTRFPGNQTIQLRYAPHGTSLLGPATTVTFTDTNERETFRHISVSKVSLVRDNGTTYYQGRKGDLALDANPFTSWHSENNQLEENKQIVVAFDAPRQFAGITYQSSGRNGRFTGVEIWVSMDDVTWTLAGTSSNWAQDNTMKTVVLENAVPARYVKLQATTVNGYVCAMDIDFFEDTTTQVAPASIHYSTTAPTQDNVTASLILTDGLTAAGESSYVFAENGEHTFAYTDAEGSQYSLTAKVSWIDREPPTAQVEYSTREITTEPVTVTILPSEEVTVTNNGGEARYTFEASGSFTFQIEDAAGNAAQIPVTVDWIRPVGKAATFSFDGDQAKRIVLDAYYVNRPVTVTYSLDGGSTTQSVSLAAGDEKGISLTAEQLAALSNISNSDGEIRIAVTSPGVAEETAVIDLLAGPAAPVLGNSDSNTQIAMHDGENWILGKIADLEYSTDGGIHWADYSAGYRFAGDQTVLVRYIGRGLTLPGAARTLTFTDNAPDFTYLPIGQVKLVSASGGQYYTNYLNFVHKGEYALDGDPFTSWHSASGAPREIIVEFDAVKQFAGVVYSGAGGRNGRIRDAEVWASLNGQDWICVGGAADWPHNESRKELKLEKSVSAKFVKLVASRTYGNQNFEADRYISTDTLDFYEDTTQIPSAATQIHYSTTRLTNGDVTATLMLAPGCTAETLTHTFTENGTREFFYTDGEGHLQAITATVTWIDKTAPTATINYSTTTVTEGPVTATITPDEAVTITNNGGSGTYTFQANGSFTFQMVDAAGNVGSVTAMVDWIIPDSEHLVSFSFSGEHPGMLVLAPFFAEREVTVEYQVCHGEPKTVELAADADKRIPLTEEERNALYTGPDQSDELRVTIHAILAEEYSRTQTIDIVNAAAPVPMVSNSPNPAAQIAIHDEEDWITGKTDNLEFSGDGQIWSPYVHGTTRFPGNQTVQVRYGAYDRTRPSNSIALTFTESSSDAFAYIPIDRVSLVSASNGQYYQSNRGEYALDGNPFTFWHSASGSPREITVKFDRVVNFAGFRYTLLDSSPNGRFKDVEVHVSLDGQNWEKAGGVTGWTWNSQPQANAPRKLVLEQPAEAQYVKLVATATTGAFASARDIDFYEDTTAPVVSSVRVEEYLRLDGKSLWLVTQPAKPEPGKVATYDGSPMFWSDKYDAYCCLVLAQTLPQEDAAARIGTAEGTAVTVAADTLDVNGTGQVDASDAQMTYNMYNAYYDGFAQTVSMEKFLRADVNCDGKVNMEDAAAIIASVLEGR